MWNTLGWNIRINIYYYRQRLTFIKKEIISWPEMNLSFRYELSNIHFQVSSTNFKFFNNIFWCQLFNRSSSVHLVLSNHEDFLNKCIFLPTLQWRKIPICVMIFIFKSENDKIFHVMNIFVPMVSNLFSH